MPHVDEVAIVTPVYNDWEAFQELLARLDAVANDLDGLRLDVIAVDRLPGDSVSGSTRGNRTACRCLEEGRRKAVLVVLAQEHDR